jgi:hypothetical protein
MPFMPFAQISQISFGNLFTLIYFTGAYNSRFALDAVVSLTLATPPFFDALFHFLLQPTACG